MFFLVLKKKATQCLSSSSTGTRKKKIKSKWETVIVMICKINYEERFLQTWAGLWIHWHSCPYQTLPAGSRCPGKTGYVSSVGLQRKITPSLWANRKQWDESTMGFIKYKICECKQDVKVQCNNFFIEVIKRVALQAEDKIKRRKTLFINWCEIRIYGFKVSQKSDMY